MKKTHILGFGLVGLLTSASASAHVDLLSPTPRLGGEAGVNQLKKKPCGQDANARTTKITTFKPGEKIEIKMKEYIPHPGYFAVGFDADGDDNLPFPLSTEAAMAAKDNPASLVNGTTILGVRVDTPDCNTQPDKTCTLSVTLPTMKCENCTLQVIQFMTDKAIADAYYYQCADIKLAGDAAPAGGAGGGGAGGASGGSSSGGTGGASGGSSSGGTGGAATAGTSTGGTATAGTATGGAATAGSATGGAATAGAATAGAGALPQNSEDEGGCGIARRASGTASVLSALGLLFALGRRRRRAA